ncbi:DUF3291 domain-containing protein [Actinoplanes couchii]|uniref:DUF3291 domain-containing protein n=1 Tax=Actinoplanes couchii TaxID=403638 RepID=A0ABQ3X9Q3_9ACTN|nr:DUF3291 domain-containing protein [Actinoplanes couchii]MDR6325658.1 hypothetical protein [Actinoplanes couchii]GID55173.1 hypothetical protein Aco03nite_035770 [Actinoplanes couchii]
MTDFHLAQMNVATLIAPPGDPSVAEFTAGVDLMNELADRSPGFVWRLKEEDVDLAALGIRAAPANQIATMSVWESLEALRGYVYQSGHLDYLRRRREWFVPGRSALVLWWVEAGRIPTLLDGLQRLKLLGETGPGPRAFTFRRTFPAPVLSRP